jgi:hypothetical protein
MRPPPEMAMIFVSGRSRLISWMSSRPSFSGMKMSVTTRSDRVRPEPVDPFLYRRRLPQPGGPRLRAPVSKRGERHRHRRSQGFWPWAKCLPPSVSTSAPVGQASPGMPGTTRQCRSSIASGIETADHRIEPPAGKTQLEPLVLLLRQMRTQMPHNTHRFG